MSFTSGANEVSVNFTDPTASNNYQSGWSGGTYSVTWKNTGTSIASTTITQVVAADNPTSISGSQVVNPVTVRAGGTDIFTGNVTINAVGVWETAHGQGVIDGLVGYTKGTFTKRFNGATYLTLYTSNNDPTSTGMTGYWYQSSNNYGELYSKDS